MHLATIGIDPVYFTMMEASSGNHYCTSNNLCVAVDCSMRTLRHIWKQQKGRLNPKRVQDLYPLPENTDYREVLEFLHVNKKELGLNQVHPDTLIWTLDVGRGLNAQKRTKGLRGMN